MSGRPLYVSTGAFRTDDLDEILREANTLGITDLELSSGLPHRPDAVDVVRRAQDGRRFLVHNYFPAPADPFVLNLAAADPEVLERSLAHCRRGLDLSAELNAPFYAAHAGFTMQPRVNDLGRPFAEMPVVPRAQAQAIFLESVRHLVGYGRRVGAGFYIENNVVAPFNAPGGVNDRLLLADVDEMLAFAREVGDADFGYLIDVGHLKVSARTLGFDAAAAMDALVPLIRAFHLSDNDGLADSNRPFDAAAWFLPWIGRCPEAHIVLEVSRVAPAEIMSCLDAVRARW